MIILHTATVGSSLGATDLAGCCIRLGVQQQVKGWMGSSLKFFHSLVETVSQYSIPLDQNSHTSKKNK